MPVLDGIGAAKLILAERSAKCVIMLTAFSDQTYVQEALEAGVTPDALLTDVEEAMAALGELTGKTLREDITQRIFDRFCVGK